MSNNPIILSDNNKNLSLPQKITNQISRIKQMITGTTTDWQDLKAYCDEMTKKCGYKNKNTGRVIIKPKYDNLYDFRDGLASVELDDKWGLIDKNGVEITPIKYDSVGDFKEGLSGVKLNNKCGFINNNGVEITPIK